MRPPLVEHPPMVGTTLVMGIPPKEAWNEPIPLDYLRAIIAGFLEHRRTHSKDEPNDFFNVEIAGAALHGLVDGIKDTLPELCVYDAKTIQDPRWDVLVNLEAYRTAVAQCVPDLFNLKGIQVVGLTEQLSRKDSDPTQREFLATMIQSMRDVTKITDEDGLIWVQGITKYLDHEYQRDQGIGDFFDHFVSNLLIPSWKKGKKAQEPKTGAEKAAFLKALNSLKNYGFFQMAYFIWKAMREERVLAYTRKEEEAHRQVARAFWARTVGREASEKMYPYIDPFPGVEGKKIPPHKDAVDLQDCEPYRVAGGVKERNPLEHRILITDTADDIDRKLKAAPEVVRLKYARVLAGFLADLHTLADQGARVDVKISRELYGSPELLDRDDHIATNYPTTVSTVAEVMKLFAQDVGRLEQREALEEYANLAMKV